MVHKRDFNNTSSKKNNKTDHKISIDEHSSDTSGT